MSQPQWKIFSRNKAAGIHWSVLGGGGRECSSRRAFRKQTRFLNLYRDEGRGRECARACVCVCLCLSRSLRSLLLKQKGTAAKQQVEMMVTVIYCIVVRGLLRACRIHTCEYYGPLIWEMQRTECWNPLQSINCVRFLTHLIVPEKD